MDNEILRTPVLGFVVTLGKYRYPEARQSAYYIFATPISGEALEDGYGEADIDIYEGDRVLGVIPAPPGCFEVYGLVGDRYEWLGIETAGASSPDWQERLEGERERARRRHGPQARAEGGSGRTGQDARPFPPNTGV